MNKLNLKKIKIGVLGELFGVARQFAGELLSSSESAYTFTEFPERGDKLKEIGKIQVHSIEELEVLWLEYFNEIVASGEVKEFRSKIINSKGDSFEDNLIIFVLPFMEDSPGIYFAILLIDGFTSF